VWCWDWHCVSEEQSDCAEARANRGATECDQQKGALLSGGSGVLVHRGGRRQGSSGRGDGNSGLISGLGKFVGVREYIPRALFPR